MCGLDGCESVGPMIFFLSAASELASVRRAARTWHAAARRPDWGRRAGGRARRAGGRARRGRRLLDMQLLRALVLLGLALATRPGEPCYGDGVFDYMLLSEHASAYHIPVPRRGGTFGNEGGLLTNQGGTNGVTAAACEQQLRRQDLSVQPVVAHWSTGGSHSICNDGADVHAVPMLGYCRLFHTLDYGSGRTTPCTSNTRIFARDASSRGCPSPPATPPPPPPGAPSCSFATAEAER
eukprot:scaffold42921_cov51-Phaeocystis_antarctica.AAC.1